MKKYKLGDIADIINGATPSTSCEDNYDGEIVWITPKDLSEQKAKYVERGSRNITQKGFNSCSAQMIPAYNILMSSRAPIGLLAINKAECCTNQGFKNIVVDRSICDVDFLYYYLKYHIKEIEALGSGTTFKEVSKVSLQQFEITIPSLDVQKHIASILADTDQKIALNRAINDNLEAMAKQLYNYWFVQFDFPNEEGKPYKSCGGKMVWNEKLKREIPEGWNVVALIDFAEIKNGATPSTATPLNYGGNIIWITPKDLSDQQSKFVYQGERNISQLGYDSCSTNLLPANSVLLSSRAPIGLVSIAMTELCTNQGFKSLVPHDANNSLYLYYYIKHHIKQIEQLGTGTTFKEVSREDLCKFPILMPCNALGYLQWVERMTQIADEQFILTKEIANLTKQRDELLPLLMNGQVSVNYHLSLLEVVVNIGKFSYFIDSLPVLLSAPSSSPSKDLAETK
ncbi:MAG: restriction endonuclease subunit S [Paraprevotella sp.]|nr:restriction endonuclease subunit S [Paraprevotella sp.]